MASGWSPAMSVVLGIGRGYIWTETETVDSDKAQLVRYTPLPPLFRCCSCPACHSIATLGIYSSLPSLRLSLHTRLPGLWVHYARRCADCLSSLTDCLAPVRPVLYVVPASVLSDWQLLVTALRRSDLHTYFSCLCMCFGTLSVCLCLCLLLLLLYRALLLLL